MGISSYGMAQRINPHSLRISVIKDWDNSVWHDEPKEIDFDSECYLRNKLNIDSSNFGLYERKIKLQKMLGKVGYKKVVNNVKILSR